MLMAERLRREGQVSVTEEWAPDGTVKRTTKMDNSMPGEAELLLKMLSLAPPEAAEVVDEAKAKGILPQDGAGVPAEPTEEVVAEQGPAMQEDDQADVKGRVSEGRQRFMVAGRRGQSLGSRRVAGYSVRDGHKAEIRECWSSLQLVSASGEVGFQKPSYDAIENEVSIGDNGNVTVFKGKDHSGVTGKWWELQGVPDGIYDKSESWRSSLGQKRVAFEVGDSVVDKRFAGPDAPVEAMVGVVQEIRESSPSSRGGTVVVKWTSGQTTQANEENLEKVGLKHKAYRRYSGDPYWMTLKYPSTCKKCGRSVPAGDEMFRFKDGSMYCDAPDCGGRESSSFDSAAQDEQMMGGMMEYGSKRTAGEWDDILRNQRGIEGYVAAIKNEDNGEVIWGNKGETHGEVIMRYWKEKNHVPSEVEVFLASTGRGFVRGFIDLNGDGRFLDQDDMQYQMGVKDEDEWHENILTENLPSYRSRVPTAMKRTSQSTREYLKTFFEEKQLPHQSWEIQDQNGTSHYIDSDVVIEALMNAPAQEQEQAANIIRKIDFMNGDVNHFLKHLATGLVMNSSEGSELYAMKKTSFVFPQRNDCEFEVSDVKEVEKNDDEKLEIMYMLGEPENFYRDELPEALQKWFGTSHISIGYSPFNTKEEFEDALLEALDYRDMNGNGVDAVVQAVAQAVAATEGVTSADLVNLVKQHMTNDAMNNYLIDNYDAMAKYDEGMRDYSVTVTCKWMSPEGREYEGSSSWVGSGDDVSDIEQKRGQYFDRLVEETFKQIMDKARVEVQQSGQQDLFASKKEAELQEGDYVKINSEFAEYPNGFVQNVDGEMAKVVYDNPGFGQGVGPLRTFKVEDLEIVRKDSRWAMKKKADFKDLTSEEQEKLLERIDSLKEHGVSDREIRNEFGGIYLDSTVDEAIAIFMNKNRTASKKEEGAVQAPVEVTGIKDTKIETWFERDRQHVALVDAATEQNTIVEWWDEAVTEAVEDGFLNPRDYHGSAYDYAKTRGLLVEKPWQETWHEEQERAGFMFDDSKQEWTPRG